MTTDPALTLAQWFSPGFPVGAFAYSHGLEWVIEQGELSTDRDLHDWIDAILAHGSGRNDAIFIGAAYDADGTEQLSALNDLCLSYCASSGRVIETSEQGAAFARTLRTIDQADVLDYAYPIAVGRAAYLCGVPLDMALRFYLHAFAANLVSAAVRRVPLGQSAGQKVLLDLQQRVEAIARDARNQTTDDLYSSIFAADIAGMNQETLYARTFRT